MLFERRAVSKDKKCLSVKGLTIGNEKTKIKQGEYQRKGNERF
jgi:hypothetical protein